MKVKCLGLLTVLLMSLMVSTVSGEPLKIMYLDLDDGVSERYGLSNFGTSSYHEEFERLLTLDGCSFQVVGSRSQSNREYELMPGDQHDTYADNRGTSIRDGYAQSPESINSGIAEMMDAYSPDVVVIFVGWNDVRSGESISSTAVAIDEIVNTIIDVNNEVKILVSNLIPWWGFSPNRNVYGDIVQLNNAIQNSQLILDDFINVFVVDTWSGFNADMMQEDLIYLDISGQAHIADAFYNSFDLAGLCLEPKPPYTLKRGDIGPAEWPHSDFITNSPKPTDVVAYPGSGSMIVPASGVTLEGVATDDMSGVRYVRVRIERRDVEPREYWNGSMWQTTASGTYQTATIMGENWTLSGVDLSQEGDYRISLVVTDRAGNQLDPASTISHFSVATPDTTEPTGVVTYPGLGSIITQDSDFSIQGTASDDSSGVRYVRVRIERRDVEPRQYWNGSMWQTAASGAYQEATLDGNTWVLPSVDLSQVGSYRIQLIVRDNAGNLLEPRSTASDFDISCIKTHVYLLVGQSNANGQAGYFLDPVQNLPGREPTGSNATYTQPYNGINYAYRTVVRTTWTVDYDYNFGPLSVRYGNNGQGPNYRMGVEVSLGRLLDGPYRNAEWSERDKVTLLKFGAGGTSITSWHPSDPEGLHTLFMEFLAEKVAELQQTECEIVFEDMFWIQGEADTGNQTKVNGYVSKFQDFMSAVNALYSFRPIFSMLKTPDATQSPNRALYTPVLNQNMKNAGYLTTVDNNDLMFIDQNSLNSVAINQHYDAASYIELGRRLAQATVSGL